jgi:carboxypeptidase Taq
VSEIARQQAIAYESWKKAKLTKDFAIFKPDLEKMFELKMQSAEILMEPKGVKTPYDAMIDFFEPKLTQEIITKVFEELKSGPSSNNRKDMQHTLRRSTSPY